MGVKDYFDAVQSSFLKHLDRFAELDEFPRPPLPETIYAPECDDEYCQLYGRALSEASSGSLAGRVIPLVDDVHERYGDFMLAAQVLGSDDQELWVAVDRLYHSLTKLRPSGASNGEPEADTKNVRCPKSADLLDLANKIAFDASGRTKIDIATEHCEGNKKKAEGLLRSISRYRPYIDRLRG